MSNKPLAQVGREDVAWAPEVEGELVQPLPLGIESEAKEVVYQPLPWIRVGHAAMLIDEDTAAGLLSSALQQRDYILSRFPRRVTLRVTCWECGRVLEESQVTLRLEDWVAARRARLYDLAREYVEKDVITDFVYCGC